MGEIIFSVIIITVLTMIFIYMFLTDSIDTGTKVFIGISIFFTTIIMSLLSFILNSPLIK